MSYHATEYRREEDRDNKTGGWRSWFGLGDNKDRDESRDYSYSNTATYRNTNPSYGYSSAPHPERSGYSRGGYGYATSDEVSRGPNNWNTDRDYNTRAGYGTTGDRDVYYKAETRTYGGDRDTTYPPTYPTPSPYYPTPRPTGDSYYYPTSRPTTDYPTTRYTENTSRDYPTSRWTETSRDYPTGRDYPTTRPSEYPTSRTYGFSADRDVTSTSRPYTTGRDYSPRPYNTTTPYTGEYSSRYPVTGDREYTSTSRYNTEYPTTSSRYPTEYPTSRGYGYESSSSRAGQVYGPERDYTRTSYSTRY
jgi:hypothetical protein